MRRFSAITLGFFAAYAVWALLTLAELRIVPRGAQSESRIAILTTAAFAISLGALIARKAHAEYRSERGSRCRACGYILIGLREPRCPECGAAFDASENPHFEGDLTAAGSTASPRPAIALDPPASRTLTPSPPIVPTVFGESDPSAREIGVIRTPPESSRPPSGLAASAAENDHQTP